MVRRSCLLFFFIAVWLIPFFVSGWKGRSYFVTLRRLSFQYSAAGLFTKRTDSWTQHLVQVKFGDNSPAWTTLDTAALSPMGAFGYRQRVDRMLFETNRQGLSAEFRKRIADWMIVRCAALFPMHGKIVGVRFVRTIWKAGTPMMANPSDHWISPPFEGLPAEQAQVLATYTVVNGVAQPFAAAPTLVGASAALPQNSPLLRRPPTPNVPHGLTHLPTRPPPTPPAQPPGPNPPAMAPRSDARTITFGPRAPLPPPAPRPSIQMKRDKPASTATFQGNIAPPKQP